MTNYLISFPSDAMIVAPEDFAQVVEDSHAVIREAKDAGVYVFGGGIDEGVGPVKVSSDGAIEAGTYPQTGDLRGGYTILDLPSIEEAHRWAAKIATACRCAQELRAFADDVDS